MARYLRSPSCSWAPRWSSTRPRQQGSVRRSPSTTGMAEVAVFVQHHVVQHVVFRRRPCGILPYVDCAKPGCTGIHAARPAGESVGADRLRRDGQYREIGRAVRLAVRVERVEHSASESPAGAGPPTARVAPTSDRTVAGKLMRMPSNPAGAWHATSLEMGEPQSPPWATQHVYARRFISSAQARPTWSESQPFVRVCLGPLKVGSRYDTP